jgi:archaellum component FlaC
VEACCPTGKADARIDAILERLTKLENELKAVKDQNATLKNQLTQMDVFLTNNNTIVLNQNVPNPFAESTVISYMIPKNFQQAKIIFSTVTGEVIRTAEIKQSGKGLVNVFADNLSSGLYTYSLIVDGKVIDTKKMIKH